jgi:hypothetical protein
MILNRKITRVIYILLSIIPSSSFRLLGLGIGFNLVSSLEIESVFGGFWVFKSFVCWLLVEDMDERLGLSLFSDDVRDKCRCISCWLSGDKGRSTTSVDERRPLSSLNNFPSGLFLNKELEVFEVLDDDLDGSLSVLICSGDIFGAWWSLFFSEKNSNIDVFDPFNVSLDEELDKRWSSSVFFVDILGECCLTSSMDDDDDNLNECLSCLLSKIGIDTEGVVLEFLDDDFKEWRSSSSLKIGIGVDSDFVDAFDDDFDERRSSLSLKIGVGEGPGFLEALDNDDVDEWLSFLLIGTIGKDEADFFDVVFNEDFVEELWSSSSEKERDWCRIRFSTYHHYFFVQIMVRRIHEDVHS